MQYTFNGETVSNHHAYLNNYNSYTSYRAQLDAWIDASAADTQTKTALKAGIAANQPDKVFMDDATGAIAAASVDIYASQAYVLSQSGRYFSQNGQVLSNEALTVVAQSAKVGISVAAIGLGVGISAYNIWNSSTPMTTAVKNSVLLSVGVAAGEVALAGAGVLLAGASLPVALAGVAVAGAAVGLAMYALDKNWDSFAPDLLDLKNNNYTLDDAIQMIMDDYQDQLVDDFNEPDPEGLLPYQQALPQALEPFSDPDSCPVPWLPGELPPWMLPIQGTYTPLVIDLDDDGIELTNLETDAVYWDYDNNGFKEASAWVAADDALLVMDWNNNGVIDNHAELFGTTLVDGFAKLTELDSNSNNTIDSGDALFADLKVWQDLNQDGVSQSNELKTLSQAGIASISLNDTGIYTVVEGNEVRLISSITMADTSTRDIYDVWFKFDGQNTQYAGDFDLDVRTLFLPTLRGYGEVKDLYIQASINDTLFDKVNELSNMSVEDVLDPSSNFDEKFKSMLYDWADAPEGQPSGEWKLYSAYEDSRKVNFVQDVAGTEINPEGGLALYQAELFREEGLWEKIVTHYVGGFLSQTGFADLFSGTPVYNATTGVVEGVTGLSSTGLAGFETLANASSDKTYAWSIIVRVVEEVIGVDNLISGDYILLDTAIQSSVSGLDLDELHDRVLGDYNVVTGTSSGETLTGTVTDDTIDGQAGADTLIGGRGDDRMFGGEGNDLYIGGSGDDYYMENNTWSSDDTYQYDGGHDRIADLIGTDKILMGAGIALSDLHIERHIATDYASYSIWGTGAELVINVEGRGSITVLTHAQYIDLIELADTSTINLITLDDWQNGTGGNDTLTGADRAYYLNDRLNGDFGNDTLNGGLGQNLLNGDWGNDTYVYGGGVDTLKEAQGDDQIVFSNTYDPNLFTFGMNSLWDPGVHTTQDLKIFYDGELVAVVDRALSSSSYFVEDLVIDGVQTIDLTALDFTQLGTAGDDTIYGYDNDLWNDNTIYGLGGNDMIQGRSGDDYIDAGAGNDYLYGNDGNNTLFGGAGNDHLQGGYGLNIMYGGSGNDSIYGDYLVDVLYGGAGADTLNGSLSGDVFVFEGAHAFTALDTILDFNTVQGDKIDISNLLIGYVDGVSDINNFVTIATVGSNGLLSIDRDGTGSTYSSQSVVTLQGITGLDVDDLLSNGNLLAEVTNVAPIAQNDAFSGNEDTAIIGNLLSNNGSGVDDDSDDGILEVVSGTISSTNGATVVINSDGTFTYTPVANFNGSDSFNYTLVDNQGGTDTATVSLTVNAVNDAPVLVVSSGSVVENAELTLTAAMLQVTDVDNTTLTYTVTALPAHGVLKNNGVTLTVSDSFTQADVDNGLVTFLPDTGYDGSDTFSFDVTDGTNTLTDRDFSITVEPLNAAPIAQDDTFSAYRSIAITGNVLADNGAGVDSDPDSHPLSVTAGTYSSAQGGSVTIGIDGSFTYTSASAYTGADTFTYTLGDGNGGTDIGTVNVNVLAAIVGTAGVDTLNGTTGNDNIFGLASNDTINGGNGHDYIDGGTGNDTMVGGLGDDVYVVDSASDVVTEAASAGTDTIQTTVSITTLANNVEIVVLKDSSNINVTANTLNNTIYGNSGNNAMNGGTGVDTYYGGLGDDTYTFDTASDVVNEYADEGSDLVQIGVSYTLTNHIERLTLTGTTAINGTGNALNNIITGNSGINILNGGAGDDTLIGGLGNDTYVVDSVLDVVTEGASAGTDTIQTTVSLSVLANNVENILLLGTSDINATGNTLINSITGNAGNNIIDGGAGNDTMVGGLGNDTYIVDSASDVVTEAASAGTDTIETTVSLAVLANNVENVVLAGSGNINVTGNTLSNTMYGNIGNNVLNGGTGVDTYYGGLGDDTFTFDSASEVAIEINDEGSDLIQIGVSYTLSNHIERLTLTGTSAINGTGNSADNTLIGNSGNNILTGLDGNDTLNGSTGNDTMIGGLGDDIYYVDSASDVVTENVDEGNDTIYTSVTKSFGIVIENGVLTGTGNISLEMNSGNNTLTGNSGNNVLNAGGGNDTLNGGVGTDTLYGGTGDDTYIIDSGADVVNENASEGTDTVFSSLGHTLAANVENLVMTGSLNTGGVGNGLDNVITGNSGNNTLTGNAGNDTLSGGAGTDTLSGGNDNDVLKGGDGLDAMTGGSGADTFVFEAASAFNNIDTISDYNIGQSDKLNISDLLVGYTPGTSDINDFMSLTLAGSNTTVLVDRDGTGGTYSNQSIASLTGVTGLDVDDLLSNGNLIV